MSKRANGEGGIYQRADGKWVAAITVSKPGMPRKRVTAVRKTQSEALVARKELEARKDSGVKSIGRTPPTGAYLTRWLEGLDASELRESTKRRLRELLTGHVIPEIGGIELGKLT